MLLCARVAAEQNLIVQSLAVAKITLYASIKRQLCFKTIFTSDLNIYLSYHYVGLNNY